MEVSEEEKFNILRERFSKDYYAAFSGVEIVNIGALTRVEAEVKELHLNANRVVQGGMLYMIADFAFAVLSNYLHPATVSQSGHITYLRPAACSKLVAEAKEIARNGHNCVGEVVVKNENDQIICVSSFNGFIKEDAQLFLKTDN